jgi:hypothetical protein
MRGQLVKKILLLGVAVLLAALFQGELRQLFVEPFSESKSSHLLENRELAGTLERISRGGPFPYKRDGVVFEKDSRSIVRVFSRLFRRGWPFLSILAKTGTPPLIV